MTPNLKRLLAPAICSALAGLSQTANATTFHVSPTGADTNPGTKAAPFREVKACHDVAQPGDQCLIAPGDYDANFDFSKSGASSKLAGTLDCNRGATQIKGTGTSFKTELSPGDFVRCDADPGENDIDYRTFGYFSWTEVASVDSDTELTLVEGYRGVSASGDSGQAGKFVRFRGTGASPLDVRLTHWVPLASLGIKAQAAPGTSETFYFDLPHNTDTNAYFPDLSAGRYAGIMQGDWDSTEIAPTSQLIGQTQGPEHFINWQRVRGIRGTSCDSSANFATFTEQWPGTYWVDPGAGAGGADRWFYRPRNADGRPGGNDEIYVGRSRNTQVTASMLIVENLSTLAAQAGVVDTKTGSGGVQLSGGISNVLFRHYWHFGNKWGGTGRHEDNARVVLEHSRLNFGFGGYLGAYSGMYDVEVARSAKSFNGAAGAQSPEAATVFDRVWHHNSMTYLYDEACDKPGSPADYNWASGTHVGDSNGATHGWYVNQGVDEKNYSYAWILNSVIEMTTEGLLFASSGGRLRFYNNTFGQAPSGHSNAMRLSPTKSTTHTNPSQVEIYNNAFVDQKGRFNFWYRNAGTYTAIHQSDYSAFLKGGSSATILSNDGTHYSFNELVAAGFEQNGLLELDRNMVELFKDPVTQGGSDYTPLVGNPVVNAGSNTHCPSYDFYGHLRDQQCDIGAIELGGKPGGATPGGDPPTNPGSGGSSSGGGPSGGGSSSGGSSNDVESDSGCGCRLASGSGQLALFGALLPLGLLLLRRCRW